jgi:predicted metal-dependent enzyme (double-stranded beta helix superfamily)
VRRGQGTGLTEVQMFDLDTFLADCVAANGEPEPRLAVKEVLSRVVSDEVGLTEALPPTEAGIVPLHRSADLTVINVVWTPGMRLGPHDHQMWAAIGIFTGGEDNEFFRRDGEFLVESGGRSLRPGDVCLLGDDAVHAVTNPTNRFAGAIHVYGGDFFSTPRSEWRGSPPREEPYDVDRTLSYFATANAEWAASNG